MAPSTGRAPGCSLRAAALAIAATLTATLTACSGHDAGSSAAAARSKSPAAHDPAAGSRTGSPATLHSSTRAATRAAASAFRLRPASGAGHLAPGSDPHALPGDVLIADEYNYRLLLVDPEGRIRWQFPARRDLPGGRRFGPPDDAFVSPDGREIVATQESYDTVSVLSIAGRRVIQHWGHPDQPGSAPGYFSHPDDAMLLPNGHLVLADIINCRILLLAPGRWHVLRQLGHTDVCGHNPPATFGSPNGVFPMTGGAFLVTEINGDWVDAINLRGHVYWSAHPPGVAYPSDANEISPGRLLVADYSTPGQIVIFNRAGKLLWRFAPRGANALNHPSLAMPLPNGNILVNDDYNDRVIVIDPHTNRIVWQYGHRGVAGRAPGFLSNPDGVDMAPPYSLLMQIGR